MNSFIRFKSRQIKYSIMYISKYKYQMQHGPFSFSQIYSNAVIYKAVYAWFFLPHQIIIYSVHYTMQWFFSLFVFVLRFICLLFVSILLCAGQFWFACIAYWINDYTLLIGVSMYVFLFSLFLSFIIALFFMLMWLHTRCAHSLGGVYFIWTFDLT